MINLKNFRENPSFYKKKYKERFIKNSDQLVDEIISLDSSIRQILEKQQKLQEERNKISKELSISKDKKSDQFLSLSKNVLNISIWGNLSANLLKNPKINDYFIIEGYISIRKTLSTLEIAQQDKQIDISILNMYPFT